MRLRQGLLVHVHSDGRLLVFAGRKQPEGLVHKQVFQAVVSEAWGPEGPGDKLAPRGRLEAFTPQPVGVGQPHPAPPCPGDPRFRSNPAAPGLTIWAVRGPAATMGDTAHVSDPQPPGL